jgi:hypothetical protein
VVGGVQNVACSFRRFLASSMVLYQVKRSAESKDKGKAIPLLVYYNRRVFQDVEASTLEESRHMKVVRFLVLRTDHLYP